MKFGKGLVLSFILFSIIASVIVLADNSSNTTVAVNSTQICAEEGKHFSHVYNQYPEQCCSGLTEWQSGMDTRKVVNGICVVTGLLAGNPVGTCIKCGDGVCGQNENICNCPSDCSTNQTQTCPIPTCTGAYIVGYLNSGLGCPIYSCPPTTNQTQTCTDSDGGINYYSYGETDYGDGTGAADTCSDTEPGVLFENYCKDNVRAFVKYTCPSGCKDGACVQGELVSEQVKCVFKNSNAGQKCYLAGKNDVSCSGIETCTVDVSDYLGSILSWKSTCGGYAYTTITGENKYAEFSCPETNATQTCESSQCEDGSWTKCQTDYSGYCTCSTCPPIVIKPVCGNGLCESGEGQICEVSTSICEVGKECRTSESKCYYRCEQDCKNLPGIYAKLNEKFKLQVNQPAKITDYKNMKITFRDLITSSCQTTTTSSTEVQEKSAVYASPSQASSSDAGGGGSTSIIKCPNVGPMAQLEIEMPNVEGKKVITLKMNEVKNVYDVAVVFIDYDYASRTGSFIVNSQTTRCPVNCKCDANSNVIECVKPVECEPGKILCPDGACKETCTNSSIESCNYGCLYNNKCLSIGTRVSGLFCSIDGTMSNQVSSSEKCENNFECSTNVCVAGKCVSSSLLEKIMNWFKKLFGG